MSSDKNVRVRVAPSPTGDPHVGTAYVTLFNYVFAKQNGGKLILRVEDTDQNRYRKASEERILKGLKWLGLGYDEGPDVGGSYGPYRQSERLPLYKKYAEILVEKEKAYHCFCTQERLAEARETQKTEGGRFGYDRHCRHLDKREVEKKLKEGISSVIRLKMPTQGEGSFIDELRGPITIDYNQLDDQILMKSDGFPTYHLANVVDDHEMKITHVIRAEEWISSTPKHVTLYEAFGWEKPQFIHLPLLRNTDKSKISKRKNPVSLDFYRRKGILPEAMINFLGLMGWSFKSEEREKFSLEEMVSSFKFSDVSLGGPVFDQKKLSWLNQQYIQSMTQGKFLEHCREEMFSENILKSIYPLVRERLDSFDEFFEKFSFFFTLDLKYENLSLVPKEKTVSEMKTIFLELSLLLDEIDIWSLETVTLVVNSYLKDKALKPKEFYMPLRLILTGRQDSPPLLETMEALGRDVVRYRLQWVCDHIFTG
jgi:glutamyl-tRNA synthetase